MSRQLLELDEETPIISLVCNEPEGRIERHVYPMALSVENLQKFWEKSKQFPVLFDGEVNGDFKKFCELFLSVEENRLQAHGLFWRIDDFIGVYYLTHIGAHDAQIHYSFFDRRHWGRQNLTRKVIKWGFDKYKFRRLSAEIPYYANKAFTFVEKVGLKVEGRKRKAAFFRDEWFDVRCYGILAEETKSW